MITLYTFGPTFGLPDPSPFVTKAEMLLELARLPYRTEASWLHPQGAEGQAPLHRRQWHDRCRLDLHPLAHQEELRLRLRCQLQFASAPPPGRSRRCWRIISIGLPY